MGLEVIRAFVAFTALGNQIGPKEFQTQLHLLDCIYIENGSDGFDPHTVILHQGEKIDIGVVIAGWVTFSINVIRFHLAHTLAHTLTHTLTHTPVSVVVVVVVEYIFIIFFIIICGYIFWNIIGAVLGAQMGTRPFVRGCASYVAIITKTVAYAIDFVSFRWVHVWVHIWVWV